MDDIISDILGQSGLCDLSLSPDLHMSWDFFALPVLNVQFFWWSHIDADRYAL